MKKPLRLLEASWSLRDYSECFFQRYPDGSQGAFIKQAADERYSVGNAARRRESRQWMLWVGSPIAAGLLDFYESCTQS